MNRKFLTIAIFVVGVVLLTGGAFNSESVETVGVEKINSERVPMDEVTKYSSLSESEQKEFREILGGANTIETTVDDYRFIQLDNEYYLVSSEVYPPQYSMIMFLIGFMFIVFSVFQGRSLLEDQKQYLFLFDGVLYIIISMILIYPILFAGALHFPQPAISEVPVSDVSEQDSTIDIQHIRDADIRNELYQTMEGGNPVPTESLTKEDYVDLSYVTPDSPYIERYNYISSDGEYYQIITFEDQLTNGSITNLFLFGSISLLTFIGSLVEFNKYNKLRNEEN